ncbi:MAG: hypothetical protein ACI8RD_010159, partial [Bacillariaceae sp.]
GWGHVIAAEDPWRATQPINGTNWTWHGASADQVSERTKRNKNFLTQAITLLTLSSDTFVARVYFTTGQSTISNLFLL